MSFPDLAGIFGVALIVLAYGLLQFEKLSSQDAAFPALNGLGAALILYSLYYDFNLPSAIVESFWLVISLAGLIRIGLKKRR